MQAPDAAGFVGVPQPGFFYGVPQNPDAFIVNAGGYRERMSVFAAVGKTEPGGIPEPGRGTVNNFADQAQGLEGACSQSRGKKQAVKVRGLRLVCGGKDGAQPLQVGYPVAEWFLVPGLSCQVLPVPGREPRYGFLPPPCRSG